MSSAQDNHAKGKAAEKLLERVAGHAYHPSFCFPNPEDPTTRKEICDMLVVCGTRAIIWQVKSLKKHDSGSFKKAEVNKAIRQCRGARRKLEKLGNVTLTASDGQSYKVDFSKVTACHQIAVFIGDNPDFIGFYDDESNPGVHLFTDAFAQKSLSYLNTIADLAEYLAAKEKLLHKTKTSMILSGDESNLLAYYLEHKRTFSPLDKQTKNSNMVFFDADSLWNEFIKSDHFKRKNRADFISGGWDYMIHLTAEQVGHSPDRAMARRLVAILSSLSRVERRALSDAFMDGWDIAAKQEPKRLYRRLSPVEINGEKVMFVFQWLGEDNLKDRELRKDMLTLTGLVARKVHPEYTTVVGITSEQTIGQDSPMDFMLLDLTDKNWTKELQDRADLAQDKLGILKDVKMTKTTTYEFPDEK
ncbi:MAG TPA: hypothetical protein VLG13_01895 [Patescibacteria group bacterium]|nr:hypothetical protein [Patescibacteria group bacterium]